MTCALKAGEPGILGCPSVKAWQAEDEGPTSKGSGGHLGSHRQRVDASALAVPLRPSADQMHTSSREGHLHSVY